MDKSLITNRFFRKPIIWNVGHGRIFGVPTFHVLELSYITEPTMKLLLIDTETIRGWGQGGRVLSCIDLLLIDSSVINCMNHYQLHKLFLLALNNYEWH